MALAYQAPEPCFDLNFRLKGCHEAAAVRPTRQGRPALLDDAGQLRDLSAIVPDIGPAQLSDTALARLRRLKPSALPLVRGRPRLGYPVAGIGKFVAIGLNYADHAAEAGMPIPKEPVVFTKGHLLHSGAGRRRDAAQGLQKSDWEVELGVVIGRTARTWRKDALAHVAGYCVVNDVSEREFQIERGGTWDKGKGCDTFGPIAPGWSRATRCPIRSAGACGST